MVSNGMFSNDICETGYEIITECQANRNRGSEIVEWIAAFEAMLKAVLEQSESERQKMKALKAQGRDKSATYRQYLGESPVLWSANRAIQNLIPDTEE